MSPHRTSKSLMVVAGPSLKLSRPSVFLLWLFWQLAGSGRDHRQELAGWGRRWDLISALAGSRSADT